MSSLTVYVGLDYHQSFVQVCVLDPEGTQLFNHKCPNSWKAIADCVPANAKVFAAIEACTGAADLAEELIDRVDWSVSLAHTTYVSHMKKSPDKTDFTDARLLADLERVGYLPKVWLAPASLRDLRQLVRFRQQLVNERRNTKLRVGAILRNLRIESTGSRWTKAWIGWLETIDLPEQTRWVLDQHLRQLTRIQQEIRAVESRLEQVLKEDPLVIRLRSIPGIGLVTAAVLRAEIGRFDRFRSGKQLSRFCGLSPKNVSSGNKQADGGLIKAGNSQLRTILIEAAQRLGRYDGRWRILKARLMGRGKPRSVATAAVANRWVRWLYYELTQQAT